MNRLLAEIIEKISVLIFHESNDRSRSVNDVCKLAVLQFAIALDDGGFEILAQTS